MATEMIPHYYSYFFVCFVCYIGVWYHMQELVYVSLNDYFFCHYWHLGKEATKSIEKGS